MAAPDDAYPIGKPARDSGNAQQIAELKKLPRFRCQGCGFKGKGEELLGCDDQETMWCPRCRSSGWVWL